MSLVFDTSAIMSSRARWLAGELRVKLFGPAAVPYLLLSAKMHFEPGNSGTDELGSDGGNWAQAQSTGGV